MKTLKTAILISLLSVSYNSFADLNNGLVAYYCFDDATNISKDCSTNGNNGSPTGQVNSVTGVKGNAANFGGYNNPASIHIPNSSSLQFVQDFTISFALKMTGFDGMDGWGSYSTFGAHSVFAKSHDRTGMTFLAYGDNATGNVGTGVASFEWGGNKNDVGAIASNSTVDKWVTFTYVFSNSSKIAKLYADGVLIKTNENFNQDLSSINSQDLYLGKFSDSWYPLNGSLDEVRIYNRALTDNEVSELYQQGTTPKLATPTGLEITSLSPFTLKWNAVPNATSYRVVISQDKYFKGFTEKLGKSICDSSCVTFKVPINTSANTYSYTPTLSELNITYPKIGINYISIRAGSKNVENSNWGGWLFTKTNESLVSTPKKSVINNSSDFERKIRVAFFNALGSKIKDDAFYTSLAKIIKSMSTSSALESFFLRDSTIKKIANQVLKSSWINEALKDGTKSLLKSSPTFLSDVIVDAAADIIKTNYPDKTEGQLIAWEIKGGYLATKSLIIAAGSPTAGAAEYIAGGIQLNIEIWQEVLNSFEELLVAKLQANKAQAYADIADQTEKAMQRYASANTPEEKQQILNLLKEVFDSIRPSLHPILSIYTAYPFQEVELNAIEKNANSTVLDFDKAKFQVYTSLLKTDSNKANQFLNDYFSLAEKASLVP